MYILKKDLPNLRKGSEVDEKNKMIADILLDEKIKNDWLKLVENGKIDIIAEYKEMLKSEKGMIENRLLEIDKELGIIKK